MLELNDISYFYKSQKDKIVLDQISYKFEKGKMYAILGTSGSGKTTLLSLLAGLDSPVSGEITLNGENIETKGLANHRKNNISLVFQNYNLIDYLTPVENVKLGGNVDAEVLLTQMGIDGTTRKRNVMQLSGGQQQRVAIARALASQAPVLLADEPTGNLDEQTAKDIVEIFKKLAHEQDKCVIVVTHSKELAGEADEVILLRNGKIAVEEYSQQGERNISWSSDEMGSLDKLIEQTLNDKAKSLKFSEEDTNRLRCQIHSQIKQGK